MLKTRQHGLIDPPIDLGLARPRGLPGLHGLLDESMSPRRDREGAELVEPCRGHVVTGRGPQRRPVRLGQVGADRIGAQRTAGLARDAPEHLGEIEGGAQGLADGQQRLRLAKALLGLGAGVLTQPPCRQADDAHRGDEGRMERSPPPRMGHRRGVVVDGGRLEHAHDAVVHQDEPYREQKRSPLLVQGHEPDHDEEMKVELDVAAGQVNEHRGRRDEPEGGEGGLGGAMADRQRGGDRHEGDDPALEETVTPAVAGVEREARDADRVEPEHHEDAAVATVPEPIG